jgi:hypothetical protein
MPVQITVEHFNRLQDLLHDTPKKIPIVVARAINRAATTARTEAGRKAREKYYVKHGDVLKTIKIRQAYAGNLSASVQSKGKRIPLYAFRVLPKTVQPLRKVPIKAAVKRSEGLKPLGSAFVAHMRSGHMGVFLRAGKHRFPINERFGPAIPQMIAQPLVSQWVEEKAQERLNQRLQHELSRVIEGSD